MTGLTSTEARRRLAEEGRNAIARGEGRAPWRLLAAQLASPLIWLLLGACAIAAAMGALADAIAIATIVLVNALVGFFQEYRAERAVLALRSLTAPRARVIRDDKLATIPALDVVVGDVLVLEAGDLVAADARVVEVHSLRTNEASLTGESAAVDKDAAPVEQGAPLAERRDHVFMGTSVVAGTGTAEVVATGMRTELGKIAHLLETAEESATPLQLRLAGLSRVLLYACLGIVAVVAVTGLVRGLPPFVVFLSAVSLAVAAVPEGLPAIVTIALAIGVRRMAARHVLVRSLPAVESLGCTTVICTDKTGTLTTGAMRVRELWGPDHVRLLAAAAACCDAELAADEVSGIGDPTELAILIAAAEHDVRRAEIERTRPRTEVIPFDPTRKQMAIRRADGRWYVKGALEAVLPGCSSGTEGALEAAAELARRGLRVLAIAEGERQEALQLLGVIGLADPPRTEAIEAMAEARAAGIRTVMITGDHPLTARAIAHEMGMVRAGERVEDLVHARATPEDKLRIVRDWKARGEVVAMTGDGVNDAPALREAHVGIAMGKTGTEVTREASDVVLADDNYASIIAAVREGRGIFDNIRKALVYLLAGNAAELAVMLIAAITGLPLPLLPIHLLWINLVTDGFPALALVVEPTEEDAMRRPPRRSTEPLLGRPEWFAIAVTGAVQTAVTLTVFAWTLHVRDLGQARNLAFSTLVFGELLRSFAARSPDKVFWQVGALGNVLLLAVVVASVLLQLTIHQLPWTRALFEIGDLSLAECVLTLGLGLVPVTVIELAKLVRHRVAHRPLVPSHGH